MYSGLKWITREKAKVDRIACPWLIKRFIDEEAEFLFVLPDKVLEVAEREGAIPFDVKGVELGHRNDSCTFDAIIEKYGLTDSVLHELAKIVRGADTHNLDLTPQSAGLDAIAEGFRRISKDDYENMNRQFAVYDALYAYCRSKVSGPKSTP